MTHLPANVDICIFAAYFVGIAVLGLIASRHAGRTKRDYFLAGDKLPWWMVGGSIVAANISSHHFVSIMGTAYFLGFAAMNIAWPAVFLGFFALLWIFLPFYLRNGFYTMPEFLDRRYGGAARAVYSVLIFLTYVLVEIAAVLFLGALAIHTLAPSVEIWQAVIGLAVVTAMYTISGEDSLFRVTALIRSDGSFSVADAPLGRVQVAVETESRRGSAGNYVPIPAKYANVQTSGLRATIEKGTTSAQSLKFDLKSK